MAKKRQNKKKKRKKSTVRHTRAIQRDRSKRPIIAPPDEKIQQRLEGLLLPAIEAQKEFYKKLGLRSRLLPLSVMVAIVVSIIWRQLGSGGSEVSRLLRSEGLLWVSTLMVSQQANLGTAAHLSPQAVLTDLAAHPASAPRAMASPPAAFTTSVGLGSRAVHGRVGC